MMNQNDTTSPTSRVAARVRQNTVSAGIAAALLLYFSYGGGRFNVPDGDDAVAIGGAILIHTLKLGGFAMLAAAIWSASGSRHALIFDGLCSMIVGVLFIVSGAMMMIGGGGGVLYIIFGVMFIVAGKRNASEWAALAPAQPTPDRAPPTKSSESSNDTGYGK